MLKTYNVWENTTWSKRATELGDAEEVRYFWFAQVTSRYLIHIDLKLARSVAEPIPSWKHLIAADARDALSLLESSGVQDVQEVHMALQTPSSAGKGYIFSQIVSITEAYDSKDKRVLICRCENARNYILDAELYDEAQLSRKKQVWP